MDKFIMLNKEEFCKWLIGKTIKRKILIIQNHHTYSPSYKHFNGSNHLDLLKGMESYHVHNNGWSEIAQNFTTFPDGKIAVCRDLNKIPAGIKGANSNGICIEHLGNFDKGKDVMSKEHLNAILELNAILCNHFNLSINTDTIVYHHWYDLVTGKRLNGAGVTKSCPGTGFIGGNTVDAAKSCFIPQIIEKHNLLFPVNV